MGTERDQGMGLRDDYRWLLCGCCALLFVSQGRKMMVRVIFKCSLKKRPPCPCLIICGYRENSGGEICHLAKE